MGLWPWWITHIFTKRFWKSIKKDGILLTYTRGHKIVSNAHMTGGVSQKTRYVGMDSFGNKYYQDFDALYIRPRRWVQYNDYFNSWGPNGNRVPPGWHGWLSFSHDDAPTPGSDNFFHPFYQKPHVWLMSINAFTMHIPRRSVVHEKAVQYQTYRQNRFAKEWQPTTKRQQSEQKQ